MFDVLNVGLGARLAIGRGGRAPPTVVSDDFLRRDGFSCHHTETTVELVVVEEQQAFVCAVLLYLDVPGPHGGLGPAHLDDAVARRRGHTPR